MDNAKNKSNTDNVEAFLFELHELMDRYDAQVLTERLHVIMGGTRFVVCNQYEFTKGRMNPRRFQIVDKTGPR
jgi:hypothetical protein